MMFGSTELAATAPMAQTAKASIRRNLSIHDHPDKANAECYNDDCEYMVKGRQICLGECRFIFQKVWKVTMDNCAHEAAQKQ